MYGTGFTAESLARVGVRDGMQGPGIKVGSDKELIEVGRMAECDREEREGRYCGWRSQIRGCGDSL